MSTTRTTTPRTTAADNARDIAALRGEVADLAATVAAFIAAQKAPAVTPRPTGNAAVRASVSAKAKAPVVQATPLPGARSRLLPGKWETVTRKDGVTYRKRVPANGSTVGQRFTGVGTDKEGARSLVWEVRESKAGVRYYGVAA